MTLNPDEEKVWSQTIETLSDIPEPVSLYMASVPDAVLDLDEAIAENKRRHGLTPTQVRRALEITAKIHRHTDPSAIIAELPLEYTDGKGYLVHLILSEDRDAA